MPYIQTPQGRIFVPDQPEKKAEPEARINVSKMKFLAYDLGLWTENILRLARDAAEVWSYVPDQEAFQNPFKGDIGQGLDGVEKLDDRFGHSFWDKLDKADVIFIPDNTCAGMVEFLKRHGYPVAGVGKVERMETDRKYSREKQDDLGLPQHDWIPVKGITALRDLCKNGKKGWNHKEFFVKLPNEYRSIEESFPHKNYETSETTLDRLAYKLGPDKEEVVFICEEMLPGEEPGLDGITHEGDLLYPTMGGYEGKGIGILERAYMTEKELPKAFKIVDDALSPEFKKNKTRFFYSTEVKLAKDGVPHTLDLTLRKAGPGTAALQSEWIENYTEVIAGLATGTKIKPKILGGFKYGAACAFDSAEAEKDWVCVQFPKEMRRWLKLRMGCKKNGQYYGIPGLDQLGTVIGLENTVEKSISLVRDRIKEVYAKRINTRIEQLDSLLESVEKGRKNGLDF